MIKRRSKNLLRILDRPNLKQDLPLLQHLRK